MIQPPWPVENHYLHCERYSDHSQMPSSFELNPDLLTVGRLSQTLRRYICRMGPERVTPLKPMNAMSVKVASGSVCSNNTKVQDK